jgi:hypothetical protein
MADVRAFHDRRCASSAPGPKVPRALPIRHVGRGHGPVDASGRLVVDVVVVVGVVVAVVAVGLVVVERVDGTGTVERVVVVDAVDESGGGVVSGGGAPFVVGGGSLAGAGATGAVDAGLDTAGSGRTSTYRPSVSTNTAVNAAVERRTRRYRITNLPRVASRARTRS